MTNPVGRPGKPASERVKSSSINLDPETRKLADDQAVKYGFVFKSKKRAGEPNLSAFIRHLVRECE